MKTTPYSAHKWRLKSLPLAIAIASTASVSALPVNASAILEEVIVTAQKHEESVQDVPIAISAFSGDAIKELGATNVSELTSFTPGLDSNNTSSTQPAYNIRGVQTNDFNVGSDPSVAVYIDGVYASRGAGAEVPFSDVERIEVLKGPQGTLFGRNSTGGAIHIITKKPSLEEQSGEVTVSAGKHGKRDADFGYNLPINDTTALRLSGTINKSDG